MGIDPISIMTALGTAGAAHGMKRTQQYEQARAAQGAYDTAQERFEDYISNLEERYGSELRGELTPGELAAREQTVKETGKNLNQNLVRMGIQGGVGQSSVPAQALQKYVAEIDKDLNAVASQRQMQAKNIISQAEATGRAGLAPLEAGSEGAINALRGSEIVVDDMGRISQSSTNALLQAMAPQLLTYGMGSVGNMMHPGAYDVGAMTRGAGFNQVLEPFGLNTQMFAPQGGKTVQGGNVYETSYDVFGNPIQKYVGPATKTAGTSYYNPATGEYETQSMPSHPKELSPAEKTAQAQNILSKAGFNDNVKQQIGSDAYNKAVEFTSYTGSVPPMVRTDPDMGFNDPWAVVIQKGKDFYEYTGGDPNIESSWKKVRKVKGDKIQYKKE